MPEMTNTLPHKPGCPATEKPTLMGIAYFCPQYQVRLGFVPDKQAEKIIREALKADLGVK
jgi:hypothetical protein